jgi:glutaminase
MGSSPAAANVIQGLLEELHERYQALNDGTPADYIPELAKADPGDFGIALATADGRVYEMGDTRKPFTIQSISKPFAYGLALKLLGSDRMFEKVGVEPSGDAFNAISLDPTTGRPRNPMINAGAIATTAQIYNIDPARAERLLLDFFTELAGRPLGIDQGVFSSEQATGHRNRAIGHMLRNFDIIEAHPEPSLDLYFRQCSITVTCRDLAVMAATLASQGRNPLTGRQPLNAELTIRILALMATCGTYDFAGQWLYDVGMPAKSGVGGGVLAVVPGRLGIATYSPPLDSYGNSVRGVAVCNELADRLGLSLFNQYPHNTSTIRRVYRGGQRQSRRWRNPAEAALLQNHRDDIRILLVQGVLDLASLECLAAELIQISSKARILVLDLEHVTELPEEPGRLLEQQLISLHDSGVRILISRASKLRLHTEGFLETDDRPISLVNLDQAIERAEDLLLASLDQKVEIPLTSEIEETLGFLDQLQPAHRQSVAAVMEHRQYRAGDVVIRKGETGDELFLVREGRFTTTIDLPTAGGDTQQSRLATFGPGVSFGEIAFLSGQPRMANVTADIPGSCWVLSRARFDELQQVDPHATCDLLLALTTGLSRKLGATNVQLTLMEQH